jgi:Tfp pilus assembly protein PilN
MRAVNLIPADQRSGAAVGAGRSGGAAYAVLAIVGAVALLALLYGIADHQISSRKTQVASLQTRSQQAQAAASQLAPYTSFVALRQARAQAVEALVDTRFDWAHTFHEFGRVLPSGASITTLSGVIGAAGAAGGSSSSSSSAAAASGTSATPAGSVPVFTVTGCAHSQSAVAETINRFKLIDGVATVTLQSSTKPSPGVGGTTTGAGGCGKLPAYTLAVGFSPLPTASAAAAAASTRTVVVTTGVGGTR